jgi:outer membrane immunogenic protein
MLKSKLLGAALLCISVLAAGAAFAADGTPVHDWSGFYVGMNAGVNRNTYHNSDLDYYWNGADNSLQSYSVAPGLKAGYNWQFGQLVVGVEGDYNVNLGSASKETLCGSSACSNARYGVSGEVDSYGSLRARGGLALDRALLYLTAGGAYGEGSQQATANCTTGGCSPTYIANWKSAGQGCQWNAPSMCWLLWE